MSVASSRRRRLLGWLPSVLMIVVILAVVAGALAMEQSWWTQTDPAASADQKAPDGSSMLSNAGFDYVNVEGIVRVRVGAGGLSATELGMSADGDRSAQFRRPVRAVIAGGDDVHVIDDVIALTATAEGDRLVAVALTPDGVSSWNDALAYLQALAPEFGWDASVFDGAVDELGAFNRSGTDEIFTLVVGPSSGGVAVTGTLTYRRDGAAASVVLTFAPPG